MQAVICGLLYVVDQNCCNSVNKQKSVAQYSVRGSEYSSLSTVSTVHYTVLYCIVAVVVYSITVLYWFGIIKKTSDAFHT